MSKNKFPIALGCMSMSGIYGQTIEEDGVKAIQHAIDRGVTLIDTGDFYDMGANELIVRRGIEGRRDKIELSVKFGALRGPDGAWLGMDTRPTAIQTFLAYSLKRLNVDVIDIYRPARLDPNVPIEETVGTIAEMIKRGYVRKIGLSEVGVETIRKAHKVHAIEDLQIEYSLVSRGPEEKIFPVLHELGIGATLYGVLSRGLLSGSSTNGAKDFRKFLPRFSSDNRAQNDAVVAKLKAFAEARGQTPAQLAIAWALAKEPKLTPLIGAHTVAQVDSTLGALEKPLKANELAELEKLIPADAIAGTRYAEQQMAHLDSER